MVTWWLEGETAESAVKRRRAGSGAPRCGSFGVGCLGFSTDSTQHEGSPATPNNVLANPTPNTPTAPSNKPSGVSPTSPKYPTNINQSFFLPPSSNLSTTVANSRSPVSFNLNISPSFSFKSNSSYSSNHHKRAPFFENQLSPSFSNSDVSAPSNHIPLSFTKSSSPTLGKGQSLHPVTIKLEVPKLPL